MLHYKAFNYKESISLFDFAYADANLKSSMAKYTGALAQYKPHNQQEYVSRSNEWLKLLFKDDLFDYNEKKPGPSRQNYVLCSNIPNPFTGSTALTYNLPVSANISIVVTNILGQQVLEIKRNNQIAGKYSVIIDLTRNPDGIYFISLVVDHKEVNKIKAIKTH